MNTNWNSIIGIHQQALNMYAARSQLLAENLANSDTPNYKAKDIDFKSMLANYNNLQTNKALLSATNPRHMRAIGFIANMQVKYRQTQQDSIDGNSVEEQIEKSEYLENAIRYQASLNFLNSKFKGLLSAIKGN